MAKKLTRKMMPLDLIRLSPKLQWRPMEREKIDLYAELMQDGVIFPPIEVVFDGQDHWVWDGFHRVHSTAQTGGTEIMCNIQVSNFEQAVWLSYSSNGDHGIPRPKGSVKMILEDLLNNPKFAKKSTKQIAMHVHCSQRSVQVVRQQITAPEPPAESGASCAESAPTGSKTPTSPPKVTHLIDEAGNPIPPELNENWLTRAVIQGRIKELDAIKNSVVNAVEKGGPQYALLPSGRFSSSLLKVRDLLETALPYAVCPYCKGDRCKKCNNFGFLNEFTWKAIPDDAKT